MQIYSYICKVKNATIHIFKKGKEPSERSFWLKVSPQERIMALEELRKSYYGKEYEPTTRLQRFCTIIKRK